MLDEDSRNIEWCQENGVPFYGNQIRSDTLLVRNKVNQLRSLLYELDTILCDIYKIVGE